MRLQKDRREAVFLFCVAQCPAVRVLTGLLDIVQAALTVRAKRPVRAETVCARPLLLWRRVVGLTGGSDGGCASGVGLFEHFRNGLSRT